MSLEVDFPLGLSPASTLISAFCDPEQRTKSGYAQNSDLQTVS